MARAIVMLFAIIATLRAGEWWAISPAHARNIAGPLKEILEDSLSKGSQQKLLGLMRPVSLFAAIAAAFVEPIGIEIELAKERKAQNRSKNGVQTFTVYEPAQSTTGLTDDDGAGLPVYGTSGGTH